MKLLGNATIQKFIIIITILFSGCGENTSDEIHTNVQPKIELIPELIISDSDNLILSQITEIKTDSKGRIYLNDQRALRIHVYKSDGTYLSSIGQEGSGPGEFQRLTNILIDYRDRLVTIDSRLARNTIFFEKNGYWSVDQIFHIEGNGFYAIESIAPDEKVVLKKMLFKMPEPPGVYWQESELALGHLSTGLIQDEIDQFKSLAMLINNDGGLIVKPFGRTTLMDTTPDGKVFMVWNDKFNVNIFDSSLNLIDSLSVPIPNQLVTNEERTELINTMGDMFRSIGRKYLPDTKPVIKNMIVDKSENYWLQTYDKPEYLVLNKNGFTVGSFDLQSDMQLAHIDKDRIYVIQSNDKGYNVHVFRYEL